MGQATTMNARRGEPEAKPTKRILCWWGQLNELGTKHAQTNSPTTDATTHWQRSLRSAVEM